MGEPSDLTENEGSLLALVARNQPVTAYQLVMMYEQSPVSTFNTSKGAVYPIIKRLKERGFLAAERVETDKRGTETLRCTADGQRALKQWVLAIDPGFALLADPLRTRVLSLNLLTRDELLEWIVAAKRIVIDKKEEVAAYNARVDVPYQKIVNAATEGVLNAKLHWLDLLMFAAVEQDDPSSGASRPVEKAS
jgi:DNA-binding PadR family transcriptional regulator